jgi:hypothetical protein
MLGSGPPPGASSPSIFHSAVDIGKGDAPSTRGTTYQEREEQQHTEHNAEEGLTSALGTTPFDCQQHEDKHQQARLPSPLSSAKMNWGD